MLNEIQKVYESPDNQQQHEFHKKNAEPSRTINETRKVEFALRPQNRALKGGPGK